MEDFLQFLNSVPLSTTLVIAGVILLLLALVQPIGTLIAVPTEKRRLSGVLGVIFLSVGIIFYLLQLGFFALLKQISISALQVLLTVISFASLLSLVSIAGLSLRVRSKTPAIGLLALFVAYVFLRQIQIIRGFADTAILLFLLIGIVSLSLEFSVRRVIPGPRKAGKEHLKGKLTADLPKTMYEDESATITVFFTNQRHFLTKVEILRHIVVPVPSTLSMTLQAAGFDVADGQTRSHTFTPESNIPYAHYATFYWNIRPKSSGNFDLNLIAEIMNGQKVLVGHFPARVRVNKILGLTAQQVWAIAGVFGVLTGLASIGGFLLQLLRP